MKKYLLSLLLAIVILALPIVSQAANAQTTPSPTTPPAPPSSYSLNTESDVPQDFSTYTQVMFINILGTASCFIGGYNPLSEDGRCLGINAETKKIGYVENNNGGLVLLSTNLITSTFQIPISSYDYNRYLAGNFGIAEQAHAQFGEGVGFHGLSPILPIWIAFRNIAYLFFVLVFIVVGLGIMFRLNIDARAVMTLQNQLPKIVIALLLITFSYAIVGFLVDMMYVVMYLIISIFSAGDLSTITNIDSNPFDAVGGLGGIGAVTNPAAGAIGGAISSVFTGDFGSILGGSMAQILGGALGGVAGAGAGKLLGSVAGLAIGAIAVGATVFTGGASLALIPVAAATIGGTTAAGGTIGQLIGAGAGTVTGAALAEKTLQIIAYLIAYLVIMIAVLQALFRTWIILIKSFIFLIVDTILAPFWILAGLIPGVQIGAGAWIRSVIANLAVYPTVLALFSLGRSIQTTAGDNANGFVPPFVGEIGIESSGLASIIGLGIILIMPESLNIVKNALKAPDSGFGKIAAGGLAAGFGVVSKPIGTIGHRTFGEDIRGNPKAGTRFVQEKMGSLPGMFFGGRVFRDDNDRKRGVQKFGGKSEELMLESMTEQEQKEYKEKKAKKEAAQPVKGNKPRSFLGGLRKNPAAQTASGISGLMNKRPRRGIENVIGSVKGSFSRGSEQGEPTGPATDARDPRADEPNPEERSPIPPPQGLTDAGTPPVIDPNMSENEQTSDSEPAEPERREDNGDDGTGRG